MPGKEIDPTKICWGCKFWYPDEGVLEDIQKAHIRFMDHRDSNIPAKYGKCHATSPYLGKLSIKVCDVFYDDDRQAFEEI